MSGEVYDIAKRAVHAYINTGSIPQYVARQVERDVAALMEKKIREAKAQAWAEGWHAHYLEWDRQRKDPTHPITQINPYGGGIHAIL